MSALDEVMHAMATGNIRELHEQAKAELAVFERLACNGRLHAPPPEDRDRRCVSNCTTEYQADCIMRDHRGCPRRIRDAMRAQGVAPVASERRALLRRLGIPDEPAAYFATEKPQPTKAINAVIEFLGKRHQRLLVLSGGPRCGKTYGAAYAVSECSSSGMFLIAGNLGDLARDKQQWARMRALRMLAIDDASTEFQDEGGWMASRWDTLIVERYEAGLQTLLTTNKALPTFASIYGDRIAARIGERGRFIGLGDERVRVREPGEDDS